MAKVKVFSKTAWLQSANLQKAQGTITDREINDALTIWVNALDGKTKAETDSNNSGINRDDWFVEVDR